jgi:hypothetical protein
MSRPHGSAFSGNLLRNLPEFDKKILYTRIEILSYGNLHGCTPDCLRAGNVGQAFANLLVQKGKDPQKRYDLTRKVVAVVDIGCAVVSPAGLPLEDLMAHLNKGGRVEEMLAFGKKGLPGKEVLSSMPAEVLVETIPWPASARPKRPSPT